MHLASVAGDGSLFNCKRFRRTPSSMIVCRIVDASWLMSFAVRKLSHTHKFDLHWIIGLPFFSSFCLQCLWLKNSRDGGQRERCPDRVQKSRGSAHRSRRMGRAAAKEKEEEGGGLSGAGPYSFIFGHGVGFFGKRLVDTCGQLRGVLFRRGGCEVECWDGDD